MATNNYRVRVQLYNEAGELLGDADVQTVADLVFFTDGETFQQKLDSGELKGPKGDAGAKGATGEKGATGATGQRGSIWSHGTAITGTATAGTVFSSSGITSALVNDAYLNISTGNVYKCTKSGAASVAEWVYTGNIKGAKGDTGATGSQGAKGDQGAAGTPGSFWYSGTGITGTSTTETVFSGSGVSSARVNDLYLNKSTGNVYKCTVAGAASVAKWVYLSSIKGPAGAKGDTGATGAKGADGDNIKYGATMDTASDVKIFFKQLDA